MDLSESISFQMDTTSDSIDETLAKNLACKPPKATTVTNEICIQNAGNDLANHDDEITRLPPDKFLLVDETPPSSSTSSQASHGSSTPSPPLSQPESSPSTSTTSTNDPLFSQQSITTRQKFRNNLKDKNCNDLTTKNNNTTTTTNTKKSVIFDKVTVFHFNRSQGFTSIPSQGGSTLGMRRKHFLRRRLSIDMYEEVRRRSRREILLKIKFDKRKRANNGQQICDDRPMHSNSTSSSASSASNANTSDSDDESYSDFSDISDSELESDSYIFLQPIGIKLRRSLLRASGVGRIDPKEKKDCKIIRESRERTGCKCIDQCIPEYCECSRLGVNCHVDRVSFPCGCNSTGCRNPNGRTEFDLARVRRNFEEKVIKAQDGAEEHENPSIHPSDPNTSRQEV